ncbi:MAG: DUF2304 domain-containing protein [Lachnospiraceae bacterium]|nr:DUF2304 domain-containing protein [Lachnospiraceae bacterium]
METLIQIILILTGIVCLGKTLASLARRRLTEALCVPWGVVSASLILIGILFRPLGVIDSFSTSGWWLVIVFGGCMLWGGFSLSEEVSGLMRRNNELVLKVALLEHELEEWKCEKNSLCDQYAGESGSGDSAPGNAAETGSRTG